MKTMYSPASKCTSQLTLRQLNVPTRCFEDITKEMSIQLRKQDYRE